MSIQDTIKATVESKKIVIYMKGTATFPQCGFSAATIEAFKSLGVPFETVNVLADPAVRDGIKAYSQWPTIPQVFIDGKFIGGCDIIRQMHESGELKQVVDAALKK